MSKDRSSVVHAYTGLAVIHDARDANADDPRDQARVARVFCVPCTGLCAPTLRDPAPSTDAKHRNWAGVTAALVLHRTGA
jgi:hypothetical protein